MTQHRPSEPSEHHVEYVSGDAPASGDHQTSIPHQQSRPGPEDDRMLATGQPVHKRVQRPDETRVQTERRRQEQIRRQPGRRAWVPNQHGAWAMLLVPAVMGWIIGGFAWQNLLLLPFWWCGYFAFWAWSQWLRTRSARKRALLLLPMLAYTGITTMLGLVTLISAPHLIAWVVPLAPLLALAAWEVWHGRERSLASGLSTTLAASLMAAMTYSLAVRGAGGFLGLGSATVLPGSSPNGQLGGWPWMWLMTASLAAYFCGTVPHIKAMIRERYNYRLLTGSVTAHTVVAVCALWLATGGYVSWFHAALWVVLAIRSLVVPLLQWHLAKTTHRPMKPLLLGVMEMVLEVLFLFSVAT